MNRVTDPSEQGDSLLCVFPSVDLLARSAAQEIVKCLSRAIEERGRATFVLAGGKTPVPAYRHLASSPLRAEVDWERVEFFFGDERRVPPEDPESNYLTARESLLEPLGIEASRVHRIRGELDADRAAELYEQEIASSLEQGPFDLVLLGMGADGHTASLFPGSPALEENDRRVVAARTPGASADDRITLTASALGRSRHVLFLVSGASKAAAVGRVLGPPGSTGLPASLVRPAGGAAVWLVDSEAARELERRA